MKIVGTIIGVITAIIGLFAFAMPFRAFLAIGWMVGAMLVVNGIEMVILGFSKEKKDGWKIALGVLYAIGGMIILFSGIQRLLTDVMIVYMIGFCLVFNGISQVIGGIGSKKKGTKTNVLFIICGVLSAIVGLLAVTHPFLSMISVGYVIGMSLVMQGINMVILVWTLGKLKKEME